MRAWLPSEIRRKHFNLNGYVVLANDRFAFAREFLAQWKLNLLRTTMRTTVPAIAAASNAHTNQRRRRTPLAPLGYPGTQVK